MDPITAAIVAALTAGAIGGLTETSKTAITDAYHKLKDLLNEKFGAKSNVVQAIDQLETKPGSVGRKETLQEAMIAINAEQDSEMLAASKHLLMLVHSQQASFGKFTIHNNASVQGQNIGENQQITQQFGNSPK